MTKEKILSVFEDINLMYNNPNMYDVLSKMLDELVEDSKKSVEYETDEDCISRERVLLEINRIGFDAFTSYDYYSNFYDFIDGLSSEEPERKPGKWFLLDECANEGWYCDQCHKKVFKADFSNTMRKYKFCPNCGARMEVDG